jgi:hypothetical protein
LSEENAVSAIKYLTAVYMPIVAKDATMPERPSFLDENSTLFKGEYATFVDRIWKGVRSSHHKRRRNGESVRNNQNFLRQNSIDLSISLAMGILQLKRGMPPLPESLKLKARKDLKSRLTTPSISPKELVDQVARTTKELFPLGWDRNVPIPSYSPSRASCVQNTRGLGGIQHFVFDRRRAGATCRTEQVAECEMSPEELIKWNLRPDDFAHPNSVTQQEFEDLALNSQPEVFRACVEIVEDPLKARVITKNEWQCQVLKPLQKMLHSRLRSHPSFQLIGRMIDEEVISHIQPFEGSKYVSGDYSAATDNFNSDVTDACIEEILSGMVGPLSRKPEFMLLAKRSLTRLTVVDKELGEEYVMSRGQLMGSLLSFIILCIVNFSIWRHTTEQEFGVVCDGNGRGGTFDKVLINGDDIGFAATERQYNRWKRTVPLVGLTPSLGKNYFSSEFITLNTRLFARDDVLGQWYNIPFLNVGLLVRGGRDAKNGQTELGKIESLGQMHDDFVSGAEFKGSASSLFISAWESLLKKTCRNLFGPKELGGLGAHPVPNSRGSSIDGYSWRQRLIATLIRDGRISVPSGGIVQRMKNHQEAELLRRFPGMKHLDESKLPILPERWTWENVDATVESFNGSLLSRLQWLVPAGDMEKPQRDFWKKARKFSTWRSYKKTLLISWDEYASYEANKFHFLPVITEGLHVLPFWKEDRFLD